MITFLNFALIIIGVTLIGRYIICPILYWTGAILDDFNCSFLVGNGKWWFDKYNSKTIRDFIESRKNTDGYEQLTIVQYIPFVGIISEIFYLACILICTVFIFMLMILKFIIIPTVDFTWDNILIPTFAFIKKVLIKICDILHLYYISEIFKNFHNRVIEKLLNIKLVR